MSLFIVSMVMNVGVPYLLTTPNSAIIFPLHWPRAPPPPLPHHLHYSARYRHHCFLSSARRLQYDDTAQTYHSLGCRNIKHKAFKMMMLKMMLPVSILIPQPPIKGRTSNLTLQSMPSMPGGDDKDEKKEESAESKAEKEAAVGLLYYFVELNVLIFSFRRKLQLRRKKLWSRREKRCTRSRSWRGRRRGPSTGKRLNIFYLCQCQQKWAWNHKILPKSMRKV